MHTRAEVAAAAAIATAVAAAEAQQAVAHARSDLSLVRRDAVGRRRRADHLGRVLDKMRYSASRADEELLGVVSGRCGLNLNEGGQALCAARLSAGA